METAGLGIKSPKHGEYILVKRVLKIIGFTQVRHICYADLHETSYKSKQLRSAAWEFARYAPGAASNRPVFLRSLSLYLSI